MLKIDPENIRQFYNTDLVDKEPGKLMKEIAGTNQNPNKYRRCEAPSLCYLGFMF